MWSRSAWTFFVGRLRLYSLKLEVAVAPVDRPSAGGLRVAQSRDREPGVLTHTVPRWAHLDDVDMSAADVGLNLQLVPQVLGHPLSRPQADAVQVSLRKCPNTSVPLSERSSA